jgi:hypothetical protein
LLEKYVRLAAQVFEKRHLPVFIHKYQDSDLTATTVEHPDGNGYIRKKRNFTVYRMHVVTVFQ